MDDDIGVPLAQDTSNVTYGPPTPKAERVGQKRRYVPVDEEPEQKMKLPSINSQPLYINPSAIKRSVPVVVQQRGVPFVGLRAFTGRSRKRTKRNKRKRRVTRKRI
jgi:hypothetical protein